MKTLNEFTSRLKELLIKGRNYIRGNNETKICAKPFVDKWSKKEILGHLIDSGIKNLQRFTEIQFQNKPYTIYKYNQDALVKANNYQSIDASRLLDLWLAINYQILAVINLQTQLTLSYKINFENDDSSDLHLMII